MNRSDLLDPADRAEPGQAFERLVAIMQALRAPDGCPWDREQTLMSLRPYLLEEAYEVLEALDLDDADAHREELGDLLLQVVFHSQLRAETQAFDAADVVHGICDKLVRRHPHVFESQVQVDSADQVVQRWEELKKREKSERTSVLDGVPKAMPSLARAQRIQEKAARVGFDWPDPSGPMEKLEEELGELQEAVHEGGTRVADELSDLLFSAVNLARHLGVSAEDALREGVDRFERRFRQVEAYARRAQVSPEDAGPDQLNRWWDQVKEQERGS